MVKRRIPFTTWIFYAASVSGGMGINNMKHQKQKHTRKEIITVLVISNMGQKSRELHMPKFAFRLFFLVLFLIGAAFALLIGLLLSKQPNQENLRKQLADNEQVIAQLEADNANISQENARLSEENEQLRNAVNTVENETEINTDTSDAKDTELYPGAPNNYPYQGTGGKFAATYSEEQPYVSITTHTDGTVIAAGDGIVTSISSSDAYSTIIELSHDGGYLTRYMCNGQTQIQVQENAEVKSGDTLFTITADDIQFDYQILFENEPIDPLMVIEAKG